MLFTPATSGAEFDWVEPYSLKMKAEFEHKQGEDVLYTSHITGPMKLNIRPGLNNSLEGQIQTGIGKHTLEMVEYFKDQSRGLPPISLCDVQSPLNVAGNMIEINGFLMDTIMNPEVVGKFLELIGGLIADFTIEQLKILGDQLVWPGHGFPSSRVFTGFGSSDDNIMLITPEAYRDQAIPSLLKMTEALQEPVFHSCGNWSERTEVVRQIPGVSMVDGAFTLQTDPDPNPPEAIRDAFTGTGIAVCARMVGDLESIKSAVQRLWHPKLKLIAVTYCQSPDEQLRAYEFIHHHCV